MSGWPENLRPEAADDAMQRVRAFVHLRSVAAHHEIEAKFAAARSHLLTPLDAELNARRAWRIALLSIDQIVSARIAVLEQRRRAP